MQLKFSSSYKKHNFYSRLLSSLETFSQNIKSDKLEETFIEDNFAVSIVNMPTNRIKPIIGFAYGLYFFYFDLNMHLLI